MNRPACRLIALVVVTVIGLPPSHLTAASAPTAREIMVAQRQLHLVRDEDAVLLLRIVNRAGMIRERVVVRRILTGPDGLSRMLIRFLSPPDVRDTGLLTWEARDGNDDQWLYLPATGRSRRIASSSKKSRFMGTDLTYEDLRPENLAIHEYLDLGSEPVEGHESFVLEARPATERHAADSGYSRRKLWIRSDNYVTVRQEYYDKEGKLQKFATARQLAHVKGTVWRVMETEMRDVQAGTRTLIIVQHQKTDQGLSPRLFTQAELTRGSWGQ